MPSRLLTLLLVPVLALLAGCGGQELERASATTDGSQLLRETLAHSGDLKSGRLDLALRGPGDGSAHVSGPFASEGKGKLPRFALTATVRKGSESERAGATWTGEKGFITLDNTAYAVSDLVVRQIEAVFEQAGAESGAPLGVDPAGWIKDPRNEGAAQVGDAQTVKLTGTADIPRVLDDVQRLAGQARSFGLPGASLSPQERRESARAVRSMKVALYTGADDRILRRLVVDAVVRDPDTKADRRLALDLTFTQVNREQQIAAPAHAQPFSALLGKLGAQAAQLGFGFGG